MSEATPNETPYVVITADTHAGNSIDGYREYLDQLDPVEKYRGEFELPDAAGSNAGTVVGLGVATNVFARLFGSLRFVSKGDRVVLPHIKARVGDDLVIIEEKNILCIVL